MPSIRQSIRSSTASKRPTSAIADGQIALNTASGTPGIFFKDNANNIIKAGPAHYGATAPNSSPAVGGSTGNSIGEAWLDSSLTPAGWKIWNGSAWVNATPLSSATVQGLVELATDAETQAGVDAARAVTAASLQSKVSDSISTTSASGIASSTAVKTAYDLANAALPKAGGIITGNLEIGSTGSFTFEGSSADAFETTLAVTNPTADRTITFPNVTGTVITTGDTGTVTGTMIADSTIANVEISPSAAIAFSKLASLTSANIIVGNASGVPSGVAMTGDVTITNAGVTAIASNVIVNADINSAAAIAYSKLALSSGITNTDVSASAAIVYSKLALSNSIVNADINTAAAIAGTKISPDFGSQNLTTTGNITATNYIAASGTATTPSIQVGNGTTYKPGVYSPGTDQVAISTNGSGRLFIDSSGRVNIGTTSEPRKLHVSNGYSAATSLDGSLVQLISSNGNTGDFAGLGILGGSTGGSFIHFGDTDNAGVGRIGYFHSDNSFRINTNGTEVARINSSGNVGIGTSAPGGRVDIAKTGGSTAANLVLTSGGAGDPSTVDPSIQFAGSAVESVGTTKIMSTGAYNARALAFHTGTDGAGTEKARIDSSGRLLVGTSNAKTASRPFLGTATPVTPVSQIEGFQIYTDEASRCFMLRGNNNSSIFPYFALVRSKGTALGSNTAVASSDTIGALSFQGMDGTNPVEAAVISVDVDGTPGTNNMPGRLVFSTTADGAASPTERMRIDSAGLMTLAGPGIKFPATQVASADGNALDDYEEGTWTPDFRVNNSTAGVTYNSRYGFYTKIGNTVHLWGGLKLLNNGSSTGTVTITGIPFTPANIGSFQYPGQGVCMIVLKANGTVWTMSVDTSSLFFRNQTATNADTGATDADFDDDTGMLFTITYQTT